MKNATCCPKCRGTQITTFPGRRPTPFGGGNHIKIAWFTHAKVDRVVCLTCGYCEEWLTGAALAKARKHGAYIEIPSRPDGPGDGRGPGRPGAGAP